MTSKWVEYGGTSIIISRGGADLGGPDMNYVRKDVVGTWNHDGDIVRINRLGPGFPTVGYMVFQRTRGYYVWVSATGGTRFFDPETGKLGKATKVNAKVKAKIKEYEKKRADRLAKEKAKAAKKKKVAKKKTVKKRV